MSDEQRVPETLETIAERIRALQTSIDQSIDEKMLALGTSVDQSIDEKMLALGASVDRGFDELKAQLRTEVESVRGDVRLVAEALAAQLTFGQ